MAENRSVYLVTAEPHHAEFADVYSSALRAVRCCFVGCDEANALARLRRDGYCGRWVEQPVSDFETERVFVRIYRVPLK